MKQKILNFINTNKKYSIAVAYTIIAYIILLNKNAVIYSHIPIIQNFPIVIKIFDVVFSLLVLTGFIALVKMLHCPPYLKKRFRLAVERASLHNGKNEFPKLIKILPDINKKHAVILVIRNLGTTIEECDKKVSNLQTSLNCKIYAIEYGKTTKTTLFYTLPNKYVKPAIFTPNDIAIGSGGGTISELINMLVIGPTNSGKTVFMKILLYKLAKFTNEKFENEKFTNGKFWVLDFKQMDFSCLSECPRYFSDIEGCIQGFNEFYDAFESQRKSKQPSKVPCYLVIDEWAGLLQSLDNATASTMAKRLNTLLSVGRGVGYIPIIATQKPSSDLFHSARENFSCCIALGKLSPEVKKMVAGDEREKLSKRNKKREAYLIFDGYDIEQIKVDTIHDLNAFDNEIRKLLSDGAGGGA